MRHVRATKGPFAERPYYSEEEIESLCADELRAQQLLPSKPEPIRIDRFIEKKFQVVAEYEDLGEGILGITEFSATGVRAIVVARSLDEQMTEIAERVIRTTLAHEAGHGLLHAHMFAIDMPRPLFADFSNPDNPKVLCRGRMDATKSDSYKGEWWEYHANRAMAALLLPKNLVDMALEPYFAARGSMGVTAFDHSRREDAARLLSTVFNVNPAVARIRLSTMYSGADSGQMNL